MKTTTKEQDVTTTKRQWEIEMDEKMAKYRQQARETFQKMSDQALFFQNTVVRGGIDREELDREMNRRRGW